MIDVGFFPFFWTFNEHVMKRRGIEKEQDQRGDDERQQHHLLKKVIKHHLVWLIVENAVKECPYHDEQHGK